MKFVTLLICPYFTEFTNGDSANHGVRAVGKDGRNSFNVITPPGQSHKHRFVAAREPIRIDCPVHASMEYGTNSPSIKSVTVSNPGGFKEFKQAAFSSIAGGVPEPATWAMMLVGVGLAGAQMRRSRTRTANALI